MAVVGPAAKPGHEGIGAGIRIFLSYARVDIARASAIATAFESFGCEVWWDRNIAGGAAFSREIEDALHRADIVAVLWSAISRASDWVRDEAGIGRDRGILLPFRLDKEEPPLGFRQTQAIDISNWTGVADDRQLLSAIEGALAIRTRQLRPGPNESGSEPPPPADAPDSIAARPSPAKDARPPFIAVLPFVGRGAVGLDINLAEALSDEVLDSLACTSGLRILGRASVQRILEMQADPHFARERLQVSWLLEGVVAQAARDPDEVTVSVRLIDTGTGEQSWTARFKRPDGDLMSMHDDIVAWVRSSLIGSEPASDDRSPKAAEPPSVDVAVARHLIRLRQPAAIARAVALASTAIEANPRDGSAYATRAIATVVANYYSASPVRNARDIAHAARADAETAVRFAPDRSESFDALASALHYGGDRPRAIAAGERAVALNPNDLEARQHLGVYAAEDAQFARAIAEFRRAAEIDPLWPVPVVSQLMVCELTGDAQAKADVADRFRRASGDQATCDWVSAAEANASGEFARAITCSSSAIELNSALRYAVAARDHAREALFLTAAETRDPETFVARGRRIAMDVIARALGRGDAAWDGSLNSRVFAPAFVALDRDRELVELLQPRFGDAAGFEASAAVIEQAFVAVALAFERTGSSAEAARLRKAAADHLLRAEAGGMQNSQSALSWAALHATRGEKARAIGVLSAGFDQEWWAIASGPVWLGDSPLLAPLRDEPGFMKLLAACADRVNGERKAVGETPLAV